METFQTGHMNDESITLNLDVSFYNREAILNTAYYFTDQCYISLESYNDKTAKVVFSHKDKENVDLNLVIKDFSNKLIDQQLRHSIAKETDEIKKLIIKEAFAPLENVPESNNS